MFEVVFLKITHFLWSKFSYRFIIISSLVQIFMDLNMPVMGGVEATEIIRKIQNSSPEQKASTIVALTANVRDALKTDVFDEFLSKPLSKARLFRILGWIYQQHHHNTSRFTEKTTRSE